MITFGMGLKIPRHEQALAMDLGRPAWVAILLTNDLLSWDKERRMQEADGKPIDEVANALPLLMRVHGIDTDAARAMLRREIKRNVADYLGVLRDIERRSDLSGDLRRFMQALPYAISGNLAWSLTCPRYNLVPETAGSEDDKEIAAVLQSEQTPVKLVST